MGSNSEEPPTQDDEINILVTGFGPFRASHPVNPAWEIAKSLPPYLPAPPPNPKSINSLLSSPPVRILVHPEPIRVAYDSVVEIVPELWKNPNIALAIHIGMASGRQFYSIERRAHRDGYLMADVDRKFLSDDVRERMHANFPPELLTDIDIGDVWRRWKSACEGEDVRVSEDAGRYLCDFIFFTSLATLSVKKEEKRVLFLHVPVEADQTAVNRGVRITLELIRAMVQSRSSKEAPKTPVYW